MSFPSPLALGEPHRVRFNFADGYTADADGLAWAKSMTDEARISRRVKAWISEH